ncbi:hypothetical protein Q5752_001478 [Cryptotrichosporon argae]
MPTEYIALATSPSSADAADAADAAAGAEGLPGPRTYRRSHARTLLSRRQVICVLGTLAALTLVIGALHARSYIGSLVRFSPAPAPAHTLPVIEPGDNPYFSTGDIWAHNDAISARLERCAALGLLRNTSSFASRPLPAADEAAYEAAGCGHNATTVVVLASLWFAEAFSGTSTSGEAVYAQSVISTLNALGYAYVFASLGWWNHDMRKATELWRRHRHNVRTVVVDPEQASVCWDDSMADEQRCLKTATNEDGIEAWRLLSFWYWDDPGNPLGPAFTLSPSPRNDNHFLSYSIEPTCRRLPYLPASSRANPPQAYLLAKQVHYVDATPEFSWTLPALAAVQADLGVRVVGGMVDDDAETAAAVAAHGITNLGKLGKIDFYEQLATSFVLLGVGRPRISPSPWDALCMGVPFINPILQWDVADPADKASWRAQQWHMTDLEPPYVYHVHAHDLAALASAVRAALDSPIESYIPDYMQFDHVTGRMADLLTTDWRAKAAIILEDRRASGNGRLFEL